jgi:hypothetical protein
MAIAYVGYCHAVADAQRLRRFSAPTSAPDSVVPQTRLAASAIDPRDYEQTEIDACVRLCVKCVNKKSIWQSVQNGQFRKRKRVRCSPLVDRPVYPRWRRTMRRRWRAIRHA